MKDKEIISNSGENGKGIDEMTEFEITECFAKTTPCSNLTIAAQGLAWPTHLIAGPRIRDEIENMEIVVSCGGVPVLTFKGALAPKVYNSVLEFGAGSGSLAGPPGTSLNISGSDKMSTGKMGEKVVVV